MEEDRKREINWTHKELIGGTEEDRGLFEECVF